MSKELEALERVKKSHFIAMSLLIDGKQDIETEQALETIEQALKRNEPMKVDLKTKYALPYSGVYYECPKCETLQIKKTHFYCPRCRQKLDWSD